MLLPDRMEYEPMHEMQELHNSLMQDYLQHHWPALVSGKPDCITNSL